MRYTDGFTGKAILALKEAICAAEELGHTYIGSEHLLLGLLEEGSNAPDSNAGKSNEKICCGKRASGTSPRKIF